MAYVPNGMDVEYSTTVVQERELTRACTNAGKIKFGSARLARESNQAEKSFSSSFGFRFGDWTVVVLSWSYGYRHGRKTGDTVTVEKQGLNIIMGHNDIITKLLMNVKHLSREPKETKWRDTAVAVP
jgi:hypothetical protein